MGRGNIIEEGPFHYIDERFRVKTLDSTLGAATSLGLELQNLGPLKNFFFTIAHGDYKHG
jgi:hypothetical protein